MPILSNKTVRLITRRFWGLVFTLIIGFAVVVQLGREAFPLLKDYNQQISDRLGKQLGVKISIGEVQAEWEGMRPRLDLLKVIIESLDGEDIFTIDNVRAEINLLDSILRGRLYWQQINLENMQASAYQNENKTWEIVGLKTTSNTDRNFKVDDPLDVFLFGRRVSVKNLSVDLTYRGGQESKLLVPSVTLENDRGFHRIEASLQVDENEKAFSLIVEGVGDPRDTDTFSASAYLEFDSFPMEKVLAATGVEVWDIEKNKHWREGHNLDLKLWLEGERKTGVTLQGELRADGLPITLPQNVLLPEELTSNVLGQWDYENGWQIVFKGLALHWPEFSTPSINAKLYRTKDQPLRLGLGDVVVEEWLAHVESVGIHETLAGRVLSAMAPQGIAENLDLTFLPDTPDLFELRTHLKGASAKAFKGSPEFTGVDAFVQASATKGFASIGNDQPFELQFPKVYRQGFSVESAEGLVAWSVDKDARRTYVASNILNVKTKGETVKGKLYLALPFKREDGEPLMTLSLGTQNTLASKYRHYLPFTVPDALENWLDRSVDSGQLTNVEFLYAGTTRKQGKLSRAIQLIAEVEDGKIAFDEAWPPLQNVSAHIYLDDKGLDVEVSEASILGNHVAAANISLVSPPDTSRLNLSVVGSIKSDAKAAMDLLQHSPVRNAIGETFDTWEVEGDVSAEIELLIPLSEDQQQQKQKVKVNFAHSRLGITDLDLAITAVNGDLHYSSERGLHSQNLEGVFWGEKLVSKIASPKNDEGLRQPEIDFEGLVHSSQLQQWTGRPELRFATGAAQVKGKIVIPADKRSDERLQLRMHSNLEGVKLALPSPIGKESAEAKSLDVDIAVLRDHQRYHFVLDDQLALNILRGESEVSSAQVLFGSIEQEMERGFFDIAGSIDEFNLQEWNVAREQYYQYQGEAEGDADALPMRFDLTVKQSYLGSLRIDEMDVAGLGTKGDWTLFLDSEFLRGSVIAYESDRPVFMHLDHIRFSSLEENDSDKDKDEDKQETQAAPELNTSVLALQDLRKAIPVDFSTKEFSIGGENYGAWRFHLRPIENGIRLENMVADVRGMHIGDESSPAEFIWLQENGQNDSSFVGQVSTGNIAKVLDAWGQEKLMESRSAKINLATHWPGAPDEVSLASVEGLISLDVRDGNFVRGAKAGENPLLRLIALFNFDTLARRLRLDFSDLAKQGFAFDHVYGELDFRAGNVQIETPLVVESTSSKMQLTGTVDMLNEELNTDLIVTLPVASNVAVLTAMSAGLPAGVGVYLISKLFKKQVDKVSSINYSVTGGWDDPKIKVRKVLTNSQPASKSKK